MAMQESRSEHGVGRLFWSAAAVAATVIVTAAILLGGPVLEEQQKLLLSSTLLVLCSFAALMCCLRAAVLTSSARLRRSWLFFAGASVAWTAGSTVWFYYQVLAPPQPYPSAGDVCLLSAYVVAALGLVTFPVGTREAGDRARLFLDGLSVAGSLLFISHLVVLKTVFADLESGLAAAVFAAYPLSDVMLGSLAVLLLSRSADRRRLDLILLGSGLLVYAIADTVFALQGAKGEFQAGTPLDLGWAAGFLLLGLAALTSSAARPGRRHPRLGPRVTEAHAGAREQVLAAAEAIWQRVRGTELDRVAVLESAVAALLSGRLDEDDRALAEREAHKIAGSAGTFGYARASEIARELESILAARRTDRDAAMLRPRPFRRAGRSPRSVPRRWC